MTTVTGIRVPKIRRISSLAENLRVPSCSGRNLNLFMKLVNLSIYILFINLLTNLHIYLFICLCIYLPIRLIVFIYLTAVFKVSCFHLAL